MKKVLSVFAVVVMSVGMFSCQPENTVAETDALYKNLDNVDATDDDIVPLDGRNQ
ncbi:MAG TPA: hypothetical protein VKN36_02020 [Eudoraea sp.]|nr:hypothetical protein [Eudoraea sp.]